MKIDRIELFHVAIPLPKPFYPSWIPGYPQTVNRFTLIRLTTDDGIQGVSAGVAFEQEREGLGGLLGPYLIGLDPSDIDTVRQRIREASYLGWRNYWIEAACWDIVGKIEEKPVWSLLGGNGRKEVSVYASTGEIHPPDVRAEEVLQLKEEFGFNSVKLRVHSFDIMEDIANIEAVRDKIGENFTIGVDENERVDFFIHQPYERYWNMTHEDLSPMFFEATIRGRLEEDEEKKPVLILKAPHDPNEYFDFRDTPVEERSPGRFVSMIHDEYIRIVRELIKTGMPGETEIQLTGLERFFSSNKELLRVDSFSMELLAKQPLTVG